MAKQLGDLKLFSVEDLSKEMDMTQVTIREYLKSGKLKGRKLGRRWYVSEDSLRQYFNEAEGSH